MVVSKDRVRPLGIIDWIDKLAPDIKDSETAAERGEKMAIKFKSLTIDLDKGIYQLNGKDISDSAYELSVVFENATWNVSITSTEQYEATVMDTIKTKE